MCVSDPLQWCFISLSLFQVLYHHIYTVERLPLTTRGYPIVIETKTFQQLHLIIPKENECLDVIATINIFARPGNHVCDCVCVCVDRVLLVMWLTVINLASVF